MSGETCKFFNFYTESSNFWPMDIHTASSLGDVSFFMRNDIGQIKAQLSVANSLGWTPLMYACSRGHSLLVNYLLSLGAERGSKTNSGVTPLMLSVTSGDLSTVESVFDVEHMEEEDYRKWTALFYSLHFTREKCLYYLLQKGANVNIVDFQNETPLMLAIKLGRDIMVKLILQSATNLDVVSYKQESALMLADEMSNEKIKTMVQERYEFLKSNNQNGAKFQSTLTVQSATPRTKSLLQHCSPTSLKEQFKHHIKLGKSFTYSPGKATKMESTSSLSSPWKASKKFLSPKLSRSNKSVREFLRKLELEKYWPIFRDEEVDFETLMTLNEENLKELGIVLLGPRKKILGAIQQMRIPYFKS